MQDKKTLIILTPAFPGDESPEQSVWLPAKQSLIKCLNENYPWLEIIILSFQFPIERGNYYWNQNKVIPFCGKNRRHGRQWQIRYQVFREMKRLKKDKDILAILSFWCAECCLVGHYFGLFYHIRHYCWICGQDAKKENQFVKRIRPRPNELVAMSDFLLESFQKNHGIRPAWIIPDAIDISLFGKQPKIRDIDIIGAGGLSTLKQYCMFIEVVAEIKKNYPDVSACLCGDGEERENLHEQIKKLDLEQNIRLTGVLPQTMVLALMQRSKILLHPSLYEGFGNVCIEALYAGAEVISFVQPMKQQILHWQIAHDKADMILRIMNLLRNKSLSHEPVLPFDMHDSANKFMHLFQSASICQDQSRNHNS